MNRNGKALVALCFLLTGGATPLLYSQPTPSPRAQQPSSNLNAAPDPNGVPATSETQSQTPPPIPVMAGGARGTVGGIDALLVQLSSVTADLRQFVTGGLAAFKGDGLDGAGALTPAGYQDAIREDCSRHFTLGDMAKQPLPSGAENALVSYQMCLGFTENNRNACSSLAQYQREAPIKGDLVRKCQGELLKLKLLHSIEAHAPDSLAKCEEALGVADPPIISEANRGKACAILIGSTDAGAICSQIAPLEIRPFDAAGMRGCVREIRATFGDAKGCEDYAPNSDDHFQRDLCLARAAYLRARAAQDPKLCGSLEMCHMMMGEANSCGLFGVDLKKAYCTASASAHYAASAPLLEARQKEMKSHPHPSRETQYMEAFKQKQTYAQSLIMQLSSAIQSYEPKNSAAYKARKEKFRARRDALQNTMKEFHPISGGKKQGSGKTGDGAP